MLVPNQIKTVTVTWKTNEHYSKLGYVFNKNFDKIEVKAEHLPENSNEKVEVMCDECGETRITKSYRKDLPCKSCSKKGIKHSEEHKRKNSEAKKKHFAENRHHRTGYKYESPEVHPSYNPNLSDEDREKRRGKAEYREWAYQVKVNGNFECQVCGDNRGGNLVSHHLDSYMSNTERRYDLDNGVCLCDTCHKNFHKKFGYGNNTSEQFEQYIYEREV